MREDGPCLSENWQNLSDARTTRKLSDRNWSVLDPNIGTIVHLRICDGFQVLEAFMQGDRDLFKQHPELFNAPVWVYFHSNVEDYNRVECWGPLVYAIKVSYIELGGNVFRIIALIYLCELLLVFLSCSGGDFCLHSLGVAITAV